MFNRNPALAMVLLSIACPVFCLPFAIGHANGMQSVAKSEHMGLEIGEATVTKAVTVAIGDSSLKPEGEQYAVVRYPTRVETETKLVRASDVIDGWKSTHDSRRSR